MNWLPIEHSINVNELLKSVNTNNRIRNIDKNQKPRTSLCPRSLF